MKKLIVIIYIAAATILFGYAQADGSPATDNQPVATATITDPQAPVQIEELHARFVKNFVEINWSIATEAGNKQFEIQRKADGEDFKTIGIVFTLDDSHASKSYRFKDDLKGVKKRKVSYRIKQVDINEQCSFSNIVLAEAKHS
ncbi:MAG: hypothetical protein KF862_11380 [Chitinophagaceae bacterium]|nr:hypothetical protein [Chitinophagaceae bacterium]